jgi:hypothetical protein
VASLRWLAANRCCAASLQRAMVAVGWKGKFFAMIAEHLATANVAKTYRSTRCGGPSSYLFAFSLRHANINVQNSPRA